MFIQNQKQIHTQTKNGKRSVRVSGEEGDGCINCDPFFVNKRKSPSRILGDRGAMVQLAPRSVNERDAFCVCVDCNVMITL